VTSPVVAETNNEEDRADVYSRTARKRRLLGFTDTITDRFQSTPDPAPALIPTRSVRSPSGGSSPVDLVLSRELLSIHLPLHSSRLCVSSLLPNFHLRKKCFPLVPFHLFLPSSRFPFTSFSLQQTRLRVQPNRPERPPLPSEITIGRSVSGPSTRIVGSSTL
jgi:hypothetical protein